MIGLVLAGVLAVVALQAQAAGAAFEVRELQREVTELEYRHEALTAEVARLGAPERMRRIATEDLGMVPAEGATYVRLGDGLQPAVNGSVDPVKQVRAGQ